MKKIRFNDPGKGRPLNGSKKGLISFNMVMMIPRFIFLTIVILAIVLLVRSFVISKIDVKDIESDLFVQRALLSTSGINYYDSDIQRSYPGVVDTSKFNADTFAESMAYSSSQVLAANITLYKDDYARGKAVKSFYYNEKWYINWYPRTIKQLPGPGSVILKTYIQPIVIKDKDENYPGFVEFKVILPNS